MRRLAIPRPLACTSLMKMDTLFDRLANLETTLDTLKTQQADRGRAVDSILKEMETINENMDRQPEVSEQQPTHPRTHTQTHHSLCSAVCKRLEKRP